ncbi:MAG: NUDIX hydrolase [Lachnospiraceae bacterium]|nr:NUDIX hydrolase [Lachnospiraceae bacterium]
MELIHFEKVRDGKYLKNYELTYLNKAGREKKYEIVSHSEIRDVTEVGQRVSGVSIVVTMGEKLLLLKEFRMGVNRTIYNLCAGMIEAGETIEDCVRRELYEETGLELKEIVDVLPPSFAAVGLSDVKNQVVLAKVCEPERETESHTSDNEEIRAAFYTRDEAARLVRSAEFSSRAQIITYFFSRGML